MAQLGFDDLQYSCTYLYIPVHIILAALSPNTKVFQNPSRHPSNALLRHLSAETLAPMRSIMPV